MKWFQLSVKKLIGMSADKSQDKKLEDALDFKYGNYDYGDDARSLTEVDFGEKFQEIIDKNIEGTRNDKQLLLAGSNDGYEIHFLSDFKITALDLSSKALDRLKKSFPSVKTVHANIENLPFDNQSFDIYVCLRAIHSSNIDLEKALEESIRVIKKGGVLVYSVSNAYRMNDNLIKGMYLPLEEKIDNKKSYLISEKIKDFLEGKGFKPQIVEIPSEIFIIAKI